MRNTMRKVGELMVSFSLFKDAIDIFVYRHGDPSWLV